MSIEKIKEIEKLGFSFVKCRGKVPIQPQWNKLKVSFDEIQEYLKESKVNTYGVLVPKGYFVIDIDTKHNNVWRRFKTLTIETKKGFHCYFKGNTELTTKHLLDKVEIKKAGQKIMGFTNPDYVMIKNENIQEITEAEIGIFKKKIEIKRDSEGLKQLLSKLNINDYQAYDAWLNLLFASHNFCGDEFGKDVFIEWSLGDIHFTPEQIESKVNAIWTDDTKDEGGVTYKTLFKELTDIGHTIHIVDEMKGTGDDRNKSKQRCFIELAITTFMENHGKVIKLYRNENWVVYKNGIWQVVDNVYLNNLLLGIRNELDSDRTQTSITNLNYYNEMKTELAYLLYIDENFFEKKETLGICCKNGVVLFLEGKAQLKNHSHEYFFKSSYDMDFKRELVNETSTNYENFISTSLCSSIEDEDTKKKIIEYTIKTIAYAMSPVKYEPYFFYLFGSGNNGKSLFLKILRTLIGSKNCHFDSIHNFHSTNSHFTSFLVDKRVFVDEDLSSIKKIDTSILKKFSETTNITANPKNKAPFTFESNLTFFLSSNELPSFPDDVSEGIRRRANFWHFDKVISETEKDRFLFDKIKEDIEILFCKVVLYINDFVNKEDLDIPPIMKTNTNSMLMMTSAIRDFIDTKFEDEPDSFISMNAYYRIYGEFCEESGIGVKNGRLSKRELKKKLITHKDLKHSRDQAGGSWGFRNKKIR